MHPLLTQILKANQPSHILRKFQAEAYAIMPELAALHGVPQPPQWHPEGTVDEHVRQVVDLAARECREVIVFGALVHDLGKAITDKDRWPQHINHEALGVPLVRTLGERLEVPEDWIVFGQLCAKEHLNVHRFLQMRPHKQVDLLDRLGNDAMDVALVAQADARGRGPDNWTKDYPPFREICRAVGALHGVVRETPQKTRDAKAKILKEMFNV